MIVNFILGGETILTQEMDNIPDNEDRIKICTKDHGDSIYAVSDRTFYLTNRNCKYVDIYLYNVRR